MHISNFDYNLPEELIAQTPIEPRDHSRLLKLDSKTWNINDDKFYSIVDDLWKNDVLVVNKTRVINARLHGKNESGRVVEIFLHKQISDNSWDCLIFPGKKLKVWRKVTFSSLSTPKERGLGGEVILEWTIKENTETWRIIEFNFWWIEFLKIIDKLWSIPLPPYIKEKLENTERYQTVYNEVEWSAAAPTAWLHFTPELIKKLEGKWVIFEKVLLHVGLGTFHPLYTDNVLEHKMHSEYIELKYDVAERLNKYKKEWKKITAVWTTSVRVLESFSNDKWVLESWNMDTDIFIYPGYKWKFVDNIITNFHLPKSTLLMLVSSFAWSENIKKAYKYAVEKKFRFFSFGDAMFIKR